MQNVLIQWKFIKQNNIIIGITDNFKFNKSIAITKLKNILIEKVYKKSELNIFNWKYLYNNIKKLKEIYKNSGSIVLIEVDKPLKSKLKTIKEYVEIYQNKFKIYVDVLSKLDIDALIIISLLPRTYYDLPFTGIFDIIQEIFNQKGVEINIKKSIMIGNNAGRIRTRDYNKYDYNANDRAFSYNLELSFVTPEDFFLNKYHNFYWKWNKNLPNKKEINSYINKATKQNNLVELIKDKILPNNKNVIIICGPPLFQKKIICTNIANNLYKYFNTNIQIWNDNKKKDYLSNKYKICILIFDWITQTELDKLNNNNLINKIFIKIDIPINLAILLNNTYIQMNDDKYIKKIPMVKYSLYKKNIDIIKQYFIFYPKINKDKELFFKY
jgi:DNA 3'-phosphatase